MSRGSHGFTLIELLVTITLITALISIMIPCWGVITRSRSRQAATGIVMESLERARSAAITGKNDVWVILRHQDGLNQDTLRTLTKKASLIAPLDPWQPIPTGITFDTGTATLMKERPPAEILTASLNGQQPRDGEIFGSIMFQRSGRIGIPLPGGNALTIQLRSLSGLLPKPIVLSRATGRASCQ